MIDYAERMKHIMNIEIPDIIGDDELSMTHMRHEINRYRDVLIEMLPLQKKYDCRTIRDYFEELNLG